MLCRMRMDVSIVLLVVPLPLVVLPVQASLTPESKKKREHGGRKIRLSSACDRLRPTTHARRRAFGRLAPSGETRTKQLLFFPSI